ncbi:hypothetical protein ACVDG3_15990 [Meridianimarinicoccus sp. RP-17]|uniref:hypothetical protein n=1 Tax=Meridianimarinicoccus zhengii TaxID=2056810 RepID=UPI0013A68ADF|nr:hypothetical protein [Phycocomes zhengii]
MYQTPTGGLIPPKPPAAARQVAMGARHRFSGTIVTGEDEGRAIDVESHLEMQVAMVMLARRDVVHLETQVPCLWMDAQGLMQWHFFDFRLTLRDGSRVVLIVKPADKAQRPKFRETTARIAAQLTPDIADRVCVMTDRHLDPIELHNAELLHSCRTPDPEIDAAARRLVQGMGGGAVRIGTLARTLNVGGRGFRAIVRLLRCHDLELARHARIAHETFVKRSAA